MLRETGEDVAIKVQRPNVGPVILRDLFIFRSMARFVNPICKVCARGVAQGVTSLLVRKMLEGFFI